MLQIRPRKPSYEPRFYAALTPGGNGVEPLRWHPIPHPKSKEFAIQNDRFWSKLRRNRDDIGDPPSAAPRSLKHLLKQVEKGTQVRRSGLDRVLAELKLYRDTTPDPDLRSALAWLCNAQSRLVNNPT